MFRLFAVTLKGNKGSVSIPTKSADGIFNGLLHSVYWVAGVVSVIVIVVAGIYYVTSNGNPSQVSRAKNAIIAGVTGLVIVLMAFTITQFILGGI